MSDVQAVAYLETVVDLGGHCDWCGDRLEPGEVVERRPDTGKRVHEEGCLDSQRVDDCQGARLRRNRWRTKGMAAAAVQAAAPTDVGEADPANADTFRPSGATF